MADVFCKRCDEQHVPPACYLSEREEEVIDLRAEVAALKARLAGREIVIDAALHYMVPIDTIAAEETDDLMARLRELED